MMLIANLRGKQRRSKPVVGKSNPCQAMCCRRRSTCGSTIRDILRSRAQLSRSAALKTSSKTPRAPLWPPTGGFVQSDDAAPISTVAAAGDPDGRAVGYFGPSVSRPPCATSNWSGLAGRIGSTMLKSTKLVRRPSAVWGRTRSKRPFGGARQIGFIETP
jgi:hypothetical protein